MNEEMQNAILDERNEAWEKIESLKSQLAQAREVMEDISKGQLQYPELELKFIDNPKTEASSGEEE